LVDYEINQLRKNCVFSHLYKGERINRLDSEIKILENELRIQELKRKLKSIDV